MPGRSTPSKIRLRTCDAMCSPLGVRTSFSWRLPFERLLAAVGELEVDDGMRISYANQRTNRPISTFSPTVCRSREPHARMARVSEGNEMNNIYNPSKWAQYRNEDGDSELVPGVPMNRASP